MSRALIVLLFRCWLMALAPALSLGALFLSHVLVGRPVNLFPLLILVVALVTFSKFVCWFAYGVWPRSPWLWRFSRRVLGFRTVSGDRVSLLFPAGLDGVIELHEVMQWSDLDVHDLSQRFGIRLRRRLTIVLISSHQELTADFGRPMGGTVLVPANAVVLAADCPLREILRHELAHLFAARWNVCPPPLLQEGLAVWLQRTDPDRTDVAEGICSVHNFCTDPSLLFDRRYFFAPHRRHVSYALAGVFTGFLIRRFGWDSYRRFYRKADRWTFRSLFKRQFGISLEGAWRACHDESVAMASLIQRLREDQLFNPLL